MSHLCVRALGRMILLFGAVALSACTTYEKYGDIRIAHSHPILFMGATYLDFPKIPIGQRAKFSYRVPCDPRSISLTVENSAEPQPELRRSTLLRVSLFAANGTAVYDQVTDFAQLPRGSMGYVSIRRPQPPTSRQPPAPYTFTVEVLRPSARKADRLDVTSSGIN